MKRVASALLALLLIVCLFATACAKKEPAPAEMGPVTITVWHQWSGDYLNTIEAAFKDYTAEHPNVTIDLSKPEDTSNALSVAIPAGEGPDIIGWANDQIGTQALAGNIVALDDYGIDKAFLDSTYEPAAVRGVIWQGKIWGLPESQEGIAFVYNKAMVDDKYLPTDPMDFDALLAKAKAFNEDTGKYLVCNQGLGNADAYHVAPIYFGHGVPEYVDDEGNVYLDTPEAIAAAEWMVKFSEYAPAETSHDICKAMIVDGDAGAWWTGPWAIADLEAAGIDYGILPMGKPFVGIKALILSQNAVDRGNEGRRAGHHEVLYQRRGPDKDRPGQQDHPGADGRGAGRRDTGPGHAVRVWRFAEPGCADGQHALRRRAVGPGRRCHHSRVDWRPDACGSDGWRPSYR